MNTRSRSALAVLAAIVMVACEGMSAIGGGIAPLGTEGSRAMAEEGYVWTDSFDGASGVYVPSGGLVGVEVAGGEVRLLPGHNEGWVASKVLTCPAGMRYDLVLLDIDAAGGSRVQLSVLDATKEPQQVGYANETVPGFDKVEAKEMSVYGISPSAFPKLRIQATLVANGTFRPRLLAWSLYFTGVEEWRDELVGSLKRTDVRGLNLTGGVASINLSAKKGAGGGEGGDYEAYPPCAVPVYRSGGSDSIALLMPNSAHDGYSQPTTVSCTGTYGVCFDDLDLDGDLDLVLANYYYSMGYPNSAIYWNDGSDTWGSENQQGLQVQEGFRAATGDLNGDGLPDIVIGASSSTNNPDSMVFLNDGGTAFDPSPDVVLDMEASHVSVGDLDGDGYDDILLSRFFTDPAQVFLGGPDGPDATADISFAFSEYKYGNAIGDVDGDGCLDVLVVGLYETRLYYGSAGGPDTTADVQLQPGSGHYFYEGGLGDLDGDGFDDLVLYETSGSDHEILFYRGDAGGLVTSSPHSITITDFLYELELVDIDKDGYCDLAVSSWNYLNLFMGGTALPTVPDATFTLANSANDIAFAIPKHGGDKHLAYRGSFVTEAIQLPYGSRWDVMHIDADVPKDTSVEVTVLDDQKRPIAGYESVPATDLDLGGLTTYGTLRFKVLLMSELNTTTPELDRVIVKWLPPRTWRDQFYGTAKAWRTVGWYPSAGALGPDGLLAEPVLLLANSRDDASFGARSQGRALSTVLDPSKLARLPPFELGTTGASAVAAADVNGDGYTDVAFASGRSDAGYVTRSPLYMGTPVGWRDAPLHEFPTVGASDVLLTDLNGDGRCDVVFAQEYDGSSYLVNSTLFWGMADGGWNATPDVEFQTNGATGAVAADMDGDGRTDLAFSCYRDAVSTSTDSMAFLQGAAGFCGTVASIRLPTLGARAVDAGDVNRDGRIDLAFANSFAAGSAQIDSYIYLGKAAGGFEATPLRLKGMGAEDVKLADVDWDLDLDVLLANSKSNTGSRRVDSYLYLNGGAGTFATDPDVRFPTTGASAVEAFDTTFGMRRSIAFACECNGTGYELASMVFLDTATGWDTSAPLTVPTKGATAIAICNLSRGAVFRDGYLSKPITPDDPRDTGSFHTLRWTARVDVPADVTVVLRVVDATTWETLFTTGLEDGTSSVSLEDAFKVKEHPSVRLMVTSKCSSSGPIAPGAIEVDELWVNWTKRTKQPPEVLDLVAGAPTVYRMSAVPLALAVDDEYDPARELRVSVEYRAHGSTEWQTALLGRANYIDGAWRLDFAPQARSATGEYDFRVSAIDVDGEVAPWVEFQSLVTVLNNLPSAPEVRIDPGRPVTSSTLQAVIVRPASDPEGMPITYRYRWYCDGAIAEGLEADTVPPDRTSRGQNWSVEVRAFDGEGAGLPALAWKEVQNAAPQPNGQMGEPEFDEDTTDSSWVNLSTAFYDPDDDPLTWSLASAPEHMAVTIDGATGAVTIVPQPNWNGQEELVFVASDGELQASRPVKVTVRPVNDVPCFVSVDGRPIAAQPIVYSIKQGDRLVIAFVVIDVEGDELVISTNSTVLQVDEEARECVFQPDNDAVGMLRFQLQVRDVVSIDGRATLDFVVEVENQNDPMEDPRIINPRTGDKFKANMSFSLLVSCTDPDTQYGQVLNYTWTSNVSGVLGYGSSLAVRLLGPGLHIIQVTVRDPDFQKTAWVEVLIEATDEDKPPPDDDGDDDGPTADGGASTGLLLAVLVIVVAAVGAAAVLVSRRQAKDEDEGADAQAAAMSKEEALRQMAATMRQSADVLEADLKTNGNGNGHGAKAAPAAVTVARQEPGGVEVLSASVAEQRLTIEAKVTEAPSEEVKELWQEIAEGGNGNHKGTPATDRDREQLRLDDLKRKYQNAIGRLPYGIPSPELRDMDWVELSALLATGQGRTLPDGRETKLVKGRWYYSDMEDSSTFLKEHGAKPKNGNGRHHAAPGVDKSELLAKLEERFILGEISEEAYKELRAKFQE